VSNNPRSPIAEAFRSIRTNIAFASSDSPLKTILITSPGPLEGKSTITANLAYVMVQGGKRVAVVDCDLRRPKVHQFFDLNNRVGMGEMFRGNAGFSSIIQEKSKDLFVVTSGKLPPNPAELLDSDALDLFFDSISSVVDVVIIDSPPVVVTDPIIISSKVDGVLIIVHPGKTKLKSLKVAIDQFERAGARVIGLVFNRISRHDAYYYEYYKQNYYYQGNENRSSKSEENTKWFKRGGRKKRKTE
jgi:capsular exopolysaccharide synthesis family protein